MTTSCLINSYNYARFIGDALDSALGQTVPFDEIIVVDDGSTDGSLELLMSKYAQHPTIHIISKPNQGQLSCFNEGFARSKGHIIFFLDADDFYEPTYLEQSLKLYDCDPFIDFVFCGHRQFGQRDSVQLAFSEDRDLGYSVILAAFQRDWIGAPTSCLSMRRSVLERILPLPFLEDWRSRADDCLVFGASMAGARKYYHAQPLVHYRVHGENGFFGRSIDKLATYRRRLAVNALFEHLERKLSYDIQRLAEVHHREFCTIAKPSFGQLMTYFRIGRTARVSYLRWLMCAAEMTGHYVRAAMRPSPSALNKTAATIVRSTAPALRVFDPTASTVETDTRPARTHQRQAA